MVSRLDTPPPRLTHLSSASLQTQIAGDRPDDGATSFRISVAAGSCRPPYDRQEIAHLSYCKPELSIRPLVAAAAAMMTSAMMSATEMPAPKVTEAQAEPERAAAPVGPPIIVVVTIAAAGVAARHDLGLGKAKRLHSGRKRCGRR